MSQSIVTEIADYAKWRGQVYKMLTTPLAPVSLPKQMIAWYDALMSLKVSRRSTFGAQVWDFNDDEPNASRNVQGARMRLEFSSFPSLNQCAIFEVKLAALVILRAPAALGLHRYAKNIKAATLVSCFRAGLGFLGTMSTLARELIGDEFFEAEYHGIACFDSRMY